MSLPVKLWFYLISPHGWLVVLLGLAGCLISAEASNNDEPVVEHGAIVRGPPSQRRLALVFTAHEFAEGGEIILDALANHHVQGTFFLTGNFLSNPVFAPLIQRMVKEGHYVGAHSDKHLLYCAWETGRRTLVTREQFQADLEDNLKKLAQFGVKPAQCRFFLPSYEHYNREIAEWTAGMGLTLINHSGGTRSAADYTGESERNFVSSSAIFDSVLKREQSTPQGLNGFFLLFHLGSGPGRADKMHDRLPALMDRLIEKGYAFARVDELLSKDSGEQSANIHLRVNQLGYEPGSAKIAIALSSVPPGKVFEIVAAENGRVIYQGQTRLLPASAWGKFACCTELDFSAFHQPGNYRVRLDGVASLPFTISPAVYAMLPDTLLEFMRQQRCGYNPWLEAYCHTNDGRTAFGPQTNGTLIDAQGGWHDAADLLKYLLTSGNATAQMLLAWEWCRHQTNPAANPRFSDRVDALGRPGTNGVPDLLDEARWGLEWMLKLHPAPDQLCHQVADDRDHYGWRLPQNERADYGWGKGGARVVYFADGQPQGLGRYKSESTGLANLAGRYAAAMALAWQVWKDDPQQAVFARNCLKAGVEVFAMGQAKEGVQQGNSYGAPYRYAETTWADDMEWGAAELYRATGENRYLAAAKRYALLAATETWMGKEQTGHYQYYPFINLGHFRLHELVDAAFQKVLADYYREGIERCRAASAKNPFGIGVPFIWCSNNLLASLAAQCRLYESMTGDTRYRGFAARHRDWLLGRNPWGCVMFTGVGTVSPQKPHLMTTKITGRSVRGGLVDGPVNENIFNSLKGVSITEPDPLADFQDKRAVYHDDLQDYATNEPIMDGTACAILMWTLSFGW